MGAIAIPDRADIIKIYCANAAGNDMNFVNLCVNLLHYNIYNLLIPGGASQNAKDLFRKISKGFFKILPKILS